MFFVARRQLKNGVLYCEFTRLLFRVFDGVGDRAIVEDRCFSQVFQRLSGLDPWSLVPRFAQPTVSPSVQSVFDDGLNEFYLANSVCGWRLFQSVNQNVGHNEMARLSRMHAVFLQSKVWVCLSRRIHLDLHCFVQIDDVPVLRFGLLHHPIRVVVQNLVVREA